MNPCANRRFFKSETDIKTGGIGGGFTDARTVRPRCRATAVLPGDCGSSLSRGGNEERCPPEAATSNGASNCRPQLTEDSIARMPRYQRWDCMQSPL